MKLLGISSSKFAQIGFLFSILVAALILSNVDFFKISTMATLPNVSEGLTDGEDDGEMEEEEEEEMEGMEETTQEEEVEGEDVEVEEDDNVEGFVAFDKFNQVSKYAPISH